MEPSARVILSLSIRTHTRKAQRQNGQSDYTGEDSTPTRQVAGRAHLSGHAQQWAEPLHGHKDLRMAARYQHLSPGFLADVVGRLDGSFGEFRYPGVTNEKALTNGEPVSALNA
jgi:hypothetical protein